MNVVALENSSAIPVATDNGCSAADLKIPGCRNCAEQVPLGFDFSMAFQPIVDTLTGTVFAHEALVRGTAGESAGKVLAQVNERNRYVFDQRCRVRAIELAGQLGLPGKLSINFLPNAVYRPEACIRTTLAAAAHFGVPPERIIFEVTEAEKVDPAHLLAIFRHYRDQGFLTALDDFGAGYSGLNLLADFQPDIIKLDMALIRNIHQRRPRQAIVDGMLTVARELSISVIAEGIETVDEWRYLQERGVRYFQGYYFAKPAFEALPALEQPA